MDKNRLYYGDNLDVLRKLPSDSVDLVYLDPPFNSARNYNVIFARHGESATGAGAQIQAFADTWVWTQATEQEFDEYVGGGLPVQVAEALRAYRTLLGENDALAYLVNMAPRLVELRRVLKGSGSLYLHCDPTMSHYLKTLLDAIFDARNFRSEVIWKRTTAHNSAKRFGPVHDVILFYAKDVKQAVWNQQYGAYGEDYLASKYRHIDPKTGQLYRLSDLTGAGTRQGDSGKEWRGYNPTSIGRHWQPPSYCYDKYKAVTGNDLAEFPLLERLDELDRIGLIHWPNKAGGKPEHKRYLDDMQGVPLQDVWTDIDPINSRAAERLGYPTQKPLALLERLIAAASNPGDVVLDPFCGCGTTVDAAQKLGRQWVGIDITYIAIDLIVKRLIHTYGETVMQSIEVSGIPRDAAGAQALFDSNPFDFERWAVSQINAQPNEKQVGDKGIDGVARFTLDGTLKSLGQVLVSVKGGKSLNPSMVRDLDGTITQRKAELGVLITQHTPTPGMIEAVNHSGTWTHPANGQKFNRVQIITTTELLEGRRPVLPLLLTPYVAAPRAQSPSGASTLF